MDSLSAYLDRFENLIQEFFLYKGLMSDQQSAHMLIDSIPTLSETTTELIHAQVVPLTRQGVADYLREYETLQGWTSPAMREANSAEASTSERVKKGTSRSRCTEDTCYGPHLARECWSKPEKSHNRDDYLARRNGDRKQTTSASSATVVKGRKKLSPPSANAASLSENMNILSLHASYEDISPSASVATKPTSNDIWALHDTGATHNMFNDLRLFDKSDLKKVDDSNKRLKLAGGGVSLAVHSEGSVKLKAGDGSVFELKECLYIPHLSKNLIAGGRLCLKGVREHFDDGNNSSFSLVLNGLALLNRYIGKNGLMNILINPVSTFKSNLRSPDTTDSDSQLHHRRLGHVGNKYLKIMETHNCVIGMNTGHGGDEDCSICSLSKSKQLPYANTRPQAIHFLENVHVDLSGIFRVKGLGNKSYYILFCDDYSSYRHIFPLKSKEKNEVYKCFMSYIALTERQTERKLRQFTLDRGGEFLSDKLGTELREMGIVLHTTTGYTPQQNGVAERGNPIITIKA